MQLFKRKKMIDKFNSLILATFLSIGSAGYATVPDIRSCDVVWTTPSSNPAESMPFGGGDIGGNVWVENGDVFFYLQQSGCFSDNGEYLKLGRWRVSMTPNPLKGFKTFNQTLNLRDGYISFTIGNDSVNVHLNIWVDIPTRSVQLAIASDKNINLTVSYENWRTRTYVLENDNHGRFGAYALEYYPGELRKGLDNVSYTDEGIMFYHRNSPSALSPQLMISQQGLEEYKGFIVDKNSNLTFGGFISGKDFEPAPQGIGVFYDTPYEAWKLKSKRSSKSHQLTISTCRKQTATLAEWKTELTKSVKLSEKARGNHRKNIKWWNEFWNRSYILTDPYHKDKDVRAWQIGRNYQLMRYQLGCNYYGEYPSKFNGGNFTFDPITVEKKYKHDPDWRQWGGDVFTAQNQRLLYWPLLKTGDFEAMKSQFNLYEWGLNGAKAKVRKNFGHNGAMYCEYAHSSGLDIPSGWGWLNGNGRLRGIEIPFGDSRADATKGYNSIVEKGIMANPMISYHWESQVENAYMILEYNRYSGQSIDRYLPFIKNSLIFFDEHYRVRQAMRNGSELDSDGKIVFYPATSCESYRGARNPADLVSGISACLESLIGLKSDSISTNEREYFHQYLNRMPGLYFVPDSTGRTIVKPAESYKKYQNEECPQFYPLFPFNRYDIESPEIEFFRNTWERGNFIKDKIDSWHQDGIFYARMGITEKAYAYNKRKLADSPRRYPTFWGPGHDWTPDHNWGGSGMIGLQEMLLQTVDDKIYILPAWPKDRDVCFKLHAPHQTVVEVHYLGGEIIKLDVTPQSREKDIIVPSRYF